LTPQKKKAVVTAKFSEEFEKTRGRIERTGRLRTAGKGGGNSHQGRLKEIVERKRGGAIIRGERRTITKRQGGVPGSSGVNEESSRH